MFPASCLDAHPMIASCPSGRGKGEGASGDSRTQGESCEIVWISGAARALSDRQNSPRGFGPRKPGRGPSPAPAEAGGAVPVLIGTRMLRPTGGNRRSYPPPAA